MCKCSLFVMEQSFNSYVEEFYIALSENKIRLARDRIQHMKECIDTLSPEDEETRLLKQVRIGFSVFPVDVHLLQEEDGVDPSKRIQRSSKTTESISR